MRPFLKALYMYVREEALEVILSNWNLKISVTKAVNDPMENLPQFDKNKQSKAINFQENGIPYFCFSEDITNPQLWGQYAQEGRGACLAFLFPLRPTHPKYGSSEKGENASRAWTWSSDRKSFPIPILDDETVHWETLHYTNTRATAENDKKECIFTKGKDWSYEKEIRCCCSQLFADEATNNNLLYDWPMQFLAGVILGPESKYTEAYIQRKLNAGLGRDAGTTPSAGHREARWLRDNDILPWPLVGKARFHNTKYEYYCAPWGDALEGRLPYAAIALAHNLQLLKLNNTAYNLDILRRKKKNRYWPDWIDALTNFHDSATAPSNINDDDSLKEWLDGVVRALPKTLTE